MNLIIYYDYNIVSYSNKSSHAEAIPVMYKSFLFILWIYSKFIESFREILEILGILWIQSNDQFLATVLSEASLRFSRIFDFMSSIINCNLSVVSWWGGWQSCKIGVVVVVFVNWITNQRNWSQIFTSLISDIFIYIAVSTWKNSSGVLGFCKSEHF